MPCPLSSQGKSKRVFAGSSGARGVFCKGLADERGNHVLMHAKIIIGGICATGKNLEFSSSLMRKLRSSVAKYLLGESRGSRGVYSPKEMGGLSCLSSVIICVQCMLGEICLQWLSSCCPYEAGNYHPNLHPVCRHGPTLSPDDAHTVLSFRESQFLWDFFFSFFDNVTASKTTHFSLCIYENCFSVMFSAAVLFSSSCWLKVWFQSGEKIKTTINASMCISPIVFFRLMETVLWI